MAFDLEDLGWTRPPPGNLLAFLAAGITLRRMHRRAQRGDDDEPPIRADDAPGEDAGGARPTENEKENENEANGVDRSGRSVLEAARALGKRSVPSSLWGAAGHGGRDRVLPEWVLGGEKPSAG